MENPFEELNQKLENVEKMLLAVLDVLSNQEKQKLQSEQSELLTRNEVCDLLNITLPTLHQWGKNGTLVGTKIGTRIRYSRSEINEILLQGRFKYKHNRNDNTTPNN